MRLENPNYQKTLHHTAFCAWDKTKKEIPGFQV